MHATGNTSPVVPSGRVVVAVAAASGAAQWLAVQLWLPGVNMSSVWVPGGMLLAMLLLAERDAWPALLAAGAVGVAVPLLALGLAGALAVAVFAALGAGHTVLLAGILERVVGGRVTLEGRRQFMAYMAVVLVAGSALVSLIFVVQILAFRYRPVTFLVWRTAVFSALLAYLTVTPTVIGIARQWRQVRARVTRRRTELVAFVLALALTLAAIFREPAASVQIGAWAVLATLLPGLLVWATFRLGEVGVSAALLLVVMVATLATNHGLGPFAGLPPGDNALWLQLFVVAIGLPLLALGSALAHDERTGAALRRSRRRLQRLNHDLLRARESEAQRIARELHDDVGHRLALASLGLSRIRRLSEGETAREVARVEAQLHDTALCLRRLSHQLHPADMEHLGLVEALRSRCDEVRHATGLQVTCEVPEAAPALAAATSLCLYRVAQEALGNVVRHAEASRVTVTLRTMEGRAELTVRDDGRGFDTAALDGRAGLGILSMTERIRSVGGKVMVRGTPGAGTLVRALVPLEAATGA